MLCFHCTQRDIIQLVSNGNKLSALNLQHFHNAIEITGLVDLATVDFTFLNLTLVVARRAERDEGEINMHKYQD
jgi:hypothetical protein